MSTQICDIWLKQTDTPNIKRQNEKKLKLTPDVMLCYVVICFLAKTKDSIIFCCFLCL